MDETAQFKIEFFELVRILNQSNLYKNQKTEISFFIENLAAKRFLYAEINKNQKLKLAYKNDGDKWKPCGFLQLVHLEFELCKNFNLVGPISNLNSSQLTKLIKSFIF